tara:strand:- start:14195 stop:14422 length:228 start_codon:yes stop_codon:yes gene_type:complete
MSGPIAIIVLDDGETWGGVDGASICFLSKEQHESLCSGEVSIAHVEPFYELGLTDITPTPIETIYRVTDEEESSS